MRNKFGIMGRIKWEVLHPDGTRESSPWVHNIITDAGFAAVTGLIGNVGSQTAFTYLAVGTSNTTPAHGDTTLTAEITDSGLARSSVTPTRETTNVANDTLQFVKSWSVTGSKTIVEAGILNASSGGVLLAHGLPTSKAVANGDVYTLTYQIVLTDDGV